MKLNTIAAVVREGGVTEVSGALYGSIEITTAIPSGIRSEARILDWDKSTGLQTEQKLSCLK